MDLIFQQKINRKPRFCCNIVAENTMVIRKFLQGAMLEEYKDEEGPTNSMEWTCSLGGRPMTLGRGGGWGGFLPGTDDNLGPWYSGGELHVKAIDTPS